VPRSSERRPCWCGTSQPIAATLTWFVRAFSLKFSTHERGSHRSETRQTSEVRARFPHPTDRPSLPFLHFHHGSNGHPIDLPGTLPVAPFGSVWLRLGSWAAHHPFFHPLLTWTSFVIRLHTIPVRPRLRGGFGFEVSGHGQGTATYLTELNA